MERHPRQKIVEAINADPVGVSYAKLMELTGLMYASVHRYVTLARRDGELPPGWKIKPSSRAEQSKALSNHRREHGNAEP